MKQFLVLCCSLLFLVGCAEQNAHKKVRKSHNITVNIASEPGTLDPRKVTSTTDINIVRTHIIYLSICQTLQRVSIV